MDKLADTGKACLQPSDAPMTGPVKRLYALEHHKFPKGLKLGQVIEINQAHLLKDFQLN